MNEFRQSKKTETVSGKSSNRLAEVLEEAYLVQLTYLLQKFDVILKYFAEELCRDC